MTTQTSGSEVGMKWIIAVGVALCVACGAADQPTCDDADYREARFRECVGEAEYQQHKSEVWAKVDELREAQADPDSMADTMECDAMPVHACSGGEGPHCEWAAWSQGSGAKYTVKCVCLSDHVYRQAREQCDDV